MDIDAEEEYSLIDNFDCTSEGFPWPSQVVKAIEERRVLMTDVLIFDILLSLGGIKHPATLYPPRNPDILHQLLDAIEESTYDTLKKDGLIYFLLKWHRDDRAEYYAQARCIPPQFVALADAYWYLDAGENVYRAVSLLADARLNRDYTSKIIQALRLDAESHKLILRYIRTAKPLLLEPDDIDAYSIALAESNLLDAWQYQRTFPEGSEARARVIRNILTWTLTPKPRSRALTQLMAYPLSLYEEAQLHTYSLRPPKHLPVSSIPVIQDLACVRLIQSGQYAAAIKLDRQFSINSVRGKVSEQARKATTDRKQIIDEIVATLPPAERYLVEQELEKIAPATGGDVAIVVNGSTGDLSMSWETIRGPNTPAKVNGTPTTKEKQKEETPKAPPPATPQAVLQSPVPPIPHRSGAPRFGGPSPATASASASSSFAAVREMFDSMSKQTTKLQGQERETLSTKTTDPVLESQNTPSTGTSHGPSYSTPQLQTISAGPSSGGKKVSGTLLQNRGSALHAPNAFFSPPVSAGVKRPLEDASSPARRSPPPPGAQRPTPRKADMSTVSAADVSMNLRQAEPEAHEEAVVETESEPEPEAEEDVEMHEADFTLPHIEPADIAAAERARAQGDLSDVDPGELSFSLFTPVADSGTPLRSSHKTKSVVSPPGSFLRPESEDERDEHEDRHVEEAVPGDMRLDELTTPPPRELERTSRSSRVPRTQAQQPARMTRTRSAQIVAQLTRRIPGAFLDDAEEEEADVVPPLPTSTSTTSAASATRRALRKQKTKDELKTPSRPTRRSSRLSQISSSSDEQVSPEKERVSKSKKTSTRSASASQPPPVTRSTRSRKIR